MTQPLNVLVVEDSENDTLLLMRELGRGGFNPVYQRVDNAAALRKQLAVGRWEIVLSDYSMPQFSGLAALAILLETGLDIPFILISGTVGEEVAVECMKAGASDYLLKNNLKRLVPAVTRELREAQSRRQKRHAETALRENQALLALIYNHVSEMLVLFNAAADGSYRIASVNKPFLDFAATIGCPATESAWKGRGVEEALAALCRDNVDLSQTYQNRFDEVAKSGAPVFFEEALDLPRARLFTEQTLVPVGGPAGVCRHVLWACRDISERKRAEENERRLEAQLLQAKKLEALGTLAGGIAHDFNNLLAGIIGYAEIIKSDTKNFSAVQEPVMQLLNVAHRAADLVRQILTFGRKQAPSRRAVSLNLIVQEAVALLKTLVSPTVEVQTELPEELPAVLADPGQMHQVLMNLCTNSVQALPQGKGRIHVSVEKWRADPGFARSHAPLKEGDYLRLAVSDTGTGMDAATLEHIFEPFFTTKPHGQGTGLGLAVVHGIVQKHQGAVTVYSEPGKGTTFHLYLPAVERLEAVAAKPEATLPHGHGEQVLVVDDEPHLVYVAASMLLKLGYRVTTFTDPLQALAAFRADPDHYDLVITDQSMPGMRGQELARELLALRPELPILLTTGLTSSVAETRDASQLFRYILTKPYSVETLADTLRQILEKVPA